MLTSTTLLSVVSEPQESITKMDLLPARLKAARKAKGYTQAELATLTGMDQSHISYLEKGNKGASMDNLQALAAALGVTISHLVGDDVQDTGKGQYAATGSRADILGNYSAPEGLRELAADTALAQALKITDAEWEALASVKLPVDASKDGYVQLLITVRAISSTN